MSVESLMVHEVTLRTISGSSQNAIGETTYSYDSLNTTMYLEPTHGSGTGYGAGREEMASRNTPIGDWLGVGRADIDWDSWQQVDYGAHTFDIIAPARYMANPRTDTISHVELSLQEVDAPVSIDAIATPEPVEGMGG